jgi:hypothetical protein
MQVIRFILDLGMQCDGTNAVFLFLFYFLPKWKRLSLQRFGRILLQGNAWRSSY